MAAGKCMKMKSFLLLFAHFVLVLGTEHVPVLIWEARGSASKQVPDLPSLSKLSNEEFSDFFVKRVSGKKEPQPLIAVFVEENLSVEDFSWQDAEGHNGFPHLENLTSAAKRVDFFPSVHAPLKGLKRIGYEWRTLQVDQENDLSLPSQGGVVLVVKLGDARIDEDRPDFLKRHDYVINDVYSKLAATNKDVIAIYTSHHSSWVEPADEPLVRRVRSVPMLGENATFWNESSIFFYSSTTPVFSPNTADKSKDIYISKVQCQKDVRDTYESLKCKFDSNRYSLEFRFNVSNSKYWYLIVYIKDINNTSTLLSTSTEIYAPQHFSYHCSQEVVFKNGSMALTLQSFQIQPNVTKGSFDDAYDCVWFFTVPIWAGLMVTALLGIILLMGLAAIMDINTMDRFDDPKGKPITINVSE